MYEYQRTKQFFAQIADEIKEAGAQELSDLGARNISPAFRGIYFDADKETLYQINYCTRLASRILAPLASFHCTTTDELYEKAKQISWSDVISEDNSFAIVGNVSKSRITNSHYSSLRLKDGIVDSFRERSGKRPDVNLPNPDVWLNLHIRNDRALISLDTSGGSLHRRGYRKASMEAPMQETVAAAIITYSKWNGEVPLYDPMCGSGTILSEALMYYSRIPAGIFRKHFGFEYLPDFDPSIWEKVKNDRARRIRELPGGLISGSDVSLKAVEISRSNVRKLPYGDNVQIKASDFRDMGVMKKGVIITNPPYGIRMGNRENLYLLYKLLGDFLKQNCKGSTAYIYFGEREFIKKIGLKPAWKKPLKTGGLDGRLVKYELF